MDNGKKIIMENKDQEKNSLYLKLIPYFDRYGILLLLLIMITPFDNLGVLPYN